MKRFLIVLAVLLGLLLLAGIAVVFLVDVNVYKSRIESAVSGALGMEFRIRGKAGIRLLPPAGVSFSDLQLRNRGTDLASAETLKVGVKLLPLLSRRVEITELILENPVFRIEKEAAGRFNTWTPPALKKPGEKEPEGQGIPLAVASAAVKNGTLVYVDQKDGAKADISGVELTVDDLSLPAGAGVPAAKAIRFSGTLKIKKLRSGGLAVSDIEARVVAADGVYDVKPFNMELFGGKGQGEIRADLSGGITDVTANYTLSNFRAEESLAAAGKPRYLRGPLTLSERLSFRGKGANEMKRTLSGQVSLRGEELIAEGVDIDAVLSKASAARNLNLADVGAFVLAGPLGTAATKAYDFGGLYEATAQKGETRLTRLVSDWTVRNGVAEAKDVAFATRKTRIALKGKLDLVRERFAGITVAALDANGCAKLRQTIDGPFRKPQIDKVTTLESAVRPILGLFKETRDLLSASECKPFYSGSVQPP